MYGLGSYAKTTNYENEEEMLIKLNNKKISYINYLLEKEILTIDEFKIIESEIYSLNNKKTKEEEEIDKKERKDRLTSLMETFIN